MVMSSKTCTAYSPAGRTAAMARTASLENILKEVGSNEYRRLFVC